MTLISLILISLAANAAPRPTGYQVITAHPHDLEVLLPHVQTLEKNGRFWRVAPRASMPADLYRHLRQIGTEEVGARTLVRPARRRKSNIAIQRLVDQVDVTKLRADVATLSAHRSRAAGSEENRLATNWAEDRLKGLGYQTRQVCYRAGACSVVADRAGTAGSGIVLVMAHIDSVGRAFAGADDNASGTAALLEMARVLASASVTKGLRFFVTNGEENGLLGAKHYVGQLQASGELPLVKLAINMDMVGYNQNGVVELETNAPFKTLAEKFADLAHRYTSLRSKITLGAWGSDHVPFLERNVPAILTIENWDTKTPCYHQACDKPDTLNYDYAAEITKLNVAAVADEAGLR